MLLRAATVVQVLQDLKLLSFIACFILLVIAPIIRGLFAQFTDCCIACFHCPLVARLHQTLDVGPPM